MTDFSETHGLVHLGVAAAGDVELETRRISVRLLDLERIPGRPVRLDSK